MKEQDNIPSSKVKRAARFVRTGAKVGGNYVKYYTKKALNKTTTREELDTANAKTIYSTLSELKGSALKMAQLLSMERHFLPDAYTDVFALAQHNAPPLSGPLIVKTFKQYMYKTPQELFDTFDLKAVHAASIGQVHRATKGEKNLAVKVQYPGVGDSIQSDLRMVKPFALTLLGLKEQEIKPFFEEAETKLLEEVDYTLELSRSMQLTEQCQHISNIYFAKYYPEWSSTRILTMDWLEGINLSDFIKTEPSQAMRNKVGQALWDFYYYQIHTLKLTHADPHPGNFLVNEAGEVGVVDFGCVKEIPVSFYTPYFDLVKAEVQNNPEKLQQCFYDLEMLYPEDTEADKALFVPVFKQMIAIVGAPFQTDTFDFGDEAYFGQLYDYGESLARRPEILNQRKPRGVKHAMYVNRTFFGLFKLLNALKAVIRTNGSV